jgi:hypothetical protein
VGEVAFFFHAPNRARRLVTIHYRHFAIHQDQIEILMFGLVDFDSLQAVRGPLKRVFLLREEIFDDFHVEFVVLHHQDVSTAVLSKRHFDQQKGPMRN